MAWNKIINQDRVKKIFQRAILEKRIPHAYFLEGQEGIGKEALAIEFAKVVNCNEPVIGEDTIEACGVCNSCRKADKLQHPNIILIFSLPSGKASDSKADSALSRLSDEQVETVHEQIALKAEDPYHKIRLANANQIKVASIREVKRNLTLGASQKGRRVIIIMNAEEMNVEASNAFLKTLEEPHEGITIFLITSRREMILPTILSRCQQIYCEPLSDEDVKEALVRSQGISEAEAKLASVFAQGSFTRSLDFLDEDMKSLRTKVVETLRSSLRRKGYRDELSTHFDDILKSKDKQKYELFLVLLILWIRDAITYSATENKERLVNIDMEETISAFAKNFAGRDLAGTIELIEKAISQIRKNVQAQLIFVSLFLKIRRKLLYKA